MKLRVVKDRLGALRPADDESKQALAKIAAGEYMTAEIKRPRNPGRHRMFFALLDVVWSNLPEEMHERYPTIERLRWEIKVQTGYFDLHETLKGVQVPIVHSMSFASMDDVEFEVFFSKAMAVCRKYFLPGVTDKELRDAIDAQLAEAA